MFDDAARYDAEATGFTVDVAYWEGLVDERRPASALELACGTGRLLVPIARRGLALDPAFTVTGLDISRPFVEAARERIAADPQLAGVVDVVEGDMTEFDLGRTFDLIVLGFNGFAFIIGQEGQMSCLAAVRRHLAPGGWFAIDLLVPQVSYLAISERTSPLRLDFDLHDPAPDVRRLLRYGTERYDPVRQVDDSIYHYEAHLADGRMQRHTMDLAWQMTFPQELELLLRHAGLRPVQRYGGYDRAPFDRRSRTYLWVMEAAGG